MRPLHRQHGIMSCCKGNGGLTVRTYTAAAAGVLLAAAGSVSAQRIHQSMDDGWRFYRGETAGAEGPGFGDGKWRVVDLPHDFSIEDIPHAAVQPHLVLDGNGWLINPGDNPAWSAASVDDSGWRPVAVTEPNTIPENSFAWYRRHIVVPDVLRGKSFLLIIGKVDDVDDTFVNGVRIGGAGSLPPNYITAYSETRRYIVPAGLLKGDGTDVVAVRAYNGPAGGGLTASSAAFGKSSGPFDSEAVGGPGEAFSTGGPGWYRKTFDAPKSWAGKKISIDFDGVYHDASIWLNGKKIGAHPYGYTSFQLDLTPGLKLGAKNTLAVRVDTSGSHSRWYSGSGIYRHVYLTVTPPLRIAPWGVSATTPQAGADSATVAVQTHIVNDSANWNGITPHSSLRLTALDAQGKAAATKEADINPLSTEPQDVGISLTIPTPSLWSMESPSLYTLVAEIIVDGKVIDHTETHFGIRTISFDAEHGFLLNGKAVKLRGGCVHHDNGPLGSAAYDRAEERRVELLKDAGFNAIRTSHNPPSPAFLDACDRLGMVVIDEAFDCWANGKSPMDYARFYKANWQSDLRSMIERDRNHPSIVLWSIGNEIPEQATSEGNARAREMASMARSIDPTRLVTAAYSGGGGDGRDEYFGTLDVAGYNYKRGDYEGDHAKFPKRIIAATESFPKEAFDYWMPVENTSYVVGDFVWTAMDYMGEAGIGRAYYPGEGNGFSGDYPWTVAGCGDIDIIGTRKPQSYYRGILWNTGPKVAAFVDAVAEGEPNYTVSGWGWPDERANWTWPGSEGKNRTIRVYARTPKVKLIVNGRDLGEKETNQSTRFTASYTVPYAAGEVDAIGLDDQGKEVARWTLKTSGAPASIRLTPDRKTIHADGEDLSYITVELLDKDGNLCTTASDKVSFTLIGPGKLLAVGNGKPDSVESFQVPVHSAFEGRLLAIVKAGHKSGAITLKATTAGLPNVTTTIMSTEITHNVMAQASKL